MNHTFDVDIATRYGVNAAIVFQDIGYWCEHSRTNRANHYDGHYWTFNSNKALCEHYPYMSGKAIRGAVQKLVDAGLILTGNYNKLPFDRTLWYALTDEGDRLFRKGNVEFPKKANDNFPKRQMSNAQKGKPIPNTLDTKDTNIDQSPGFTEFWNAYPRKVAKQNAAKAWGKTGADDSQSLTSTILADVKRRVDGEWKGKEVQYIPHPATYLNQRRWEDESGATDTVETFERDLSVEEVMRMNDDCSVPEGFTPIGGW